MGVKDIEYVGFLLFDLLCPDDAPAPSNHARWQWAHYASWQWAHVDSGPRINDLTGKKRSSPL